MKKIIYAAAFLLLASVLPLLASAPVTDIELLRQEARATLAKGNTQWLEFDTNGDGKINHFMLIGRNHDKIYEEMDTNHNGRIDTLSYYSRGVLVREEIDTNHDGKVDLWVYISEGIYIERYARDTNYDGIIDVVQDFGS